MLKFKELILSVINEEGEAAVMTPPAKTEVPKAEEEKAEEEKPTDPSAGKTLRNWFFTPFYDGTPDGAKNKSPTDITPEIKNLRSKYDGAYGAGSAPQFAELNKIFTVWPSCYARDSAAGFLDLGKYLPYIELMAQVAGASISTTPGAKNVADKFWTNLVPKATFVSILKAFEAAIDTRPTANPIDFPITTAEGSYIARQVRKHIQTNYVGQITLDKFDGASIKDAVFRLLEPRKKARLATISNSSVPDQGKEVLEVLLSPEKFAGGNYAFSNKVSSDKIYTRAIHQDLLEIGLSAKRFFENECSRLFKREKGGEDFAYPGPLMTPTAHEKFLNNAGTSGGNFHFDLEDSTSKEGDTGYTVKEIKDLSTKSNKSAEELYALLLGLANYIREGEIIDWDAVIGGATKMAGGLSMGAPTVGGKR